MMPQSRDLRMRRNLICVDELATPLDSSPYMGFML